MTSRLQERMEARARKQELARTALMTARARHRRAAATLAQQIVRYGAVDSATLPWQLQNVADRAHLCANRTSREAFAALVLHLDRCGGRLLEANAEDWSHPFALGLVSLARQCRHWVRPLAEWRPASRNAARQFGHLARFLLARYEVPAFLDAVLFNYGHSEHESWFRHVGQGGSLRTLPGLTIPLTKRMAHEAFRAPADCTPLQALRCGQVRALGGPDELVRCVNETSLGRSTGSREQEAWRGGLIHWLANQWPFDPDLVEPIVEFALHRRRRDRRFSLKGRTPESLQRLLAERDRREAERARERVAANEGNRSRQSYRYREFHESGFQPGIWEFGRGAGRKIWMLDEIRCNRDLLQEGRSMQHCVGGYVENVLQGTSSIWSLRVERGRRAVRALTIEVDPKERTIVECRGKCNRLPNSDERKVLELWAKENNLTLDLFED